MHSLIKLHLRHCGFDLFGKQRNRSRSSVISHLFSGLFKYLEFSSKREHSKGLHLLSLCLPGSLVKGHSSFVVFIRLHPLIASFLLLPPSPLQGGHSSFSCFPTPFLFPVGTRTSSVSIIRSFCVSITSVKTPVKSFYFC